MWSEVFQDMKAFGGLPLFCFLIVFTFLLGFTKLSLDLLFGLVLAYAFVASIRVAYFKRRPDRQKYKGMLQKIDASSFPSMHSLRAAFLATIFSMQFNDMQITVLLALTAIGVAYVRVRHKRHYPLDVIVGLLCGVLIALISVWLAGKV